MNSKFLICIVLAKKSHLDPLILNFIMSLLDAFIHSLKIVVALAAILLIINAPLCAHCEVLLDYVLYNKATLKKFGLQCQHCL